MKSKLFGQNIPVDCCYCMNSASSDNITFCSKGKVIQNSKCRAFRYDPLRRVPKKTVYKKTYSAEDFKL